MNLFDLILNNLWTIAGIALTGVLIPLLIQRENRRAAASLKFRSTLLQAFAGLYPTPVQWPDKLNNVDPCLRAIFPVLQSAVAEFRPNVPWWRRRAFDEAWFRYHCSTGRKIDTQVYQHYYGIEGRPDPKVTFHSNVSRLLSFAKKT